MLVNLSDVFSSEGKRLELSVGLEMEKFSSKLGEFLITEKNPVQLVLTNIGVGKVSVKGNARVVLQMQCDRCLKEVQQPVDLQFEIEVYTPDTEVEEADYQEFMEQYSLDVEGLISNEILMSLPAKVVCKEDCKGICFKCGKNLNEGECGCSTKEIDPRLAKLMELLDN